MPDIYEKNQKLVLQLESGLASLENTANKRLRKQEKKKAKGKISDDAAAATATTDNNEVEKNNVDLAEKLVPRKKRPTHRLSPISFLPIPFVGRKVDTIDYCREEISKNNKLLEEKRADLFEYPAKGSAFIEFHTQIAAHMFAQ
jgi:hypothetical protein